MSDFEKGREAARKIMDEAGVSPGTVLAMGCGLVVLHLLFFAGLVYLVCRIVKAVFA